MKTAEFVLGVHGAMLRRLTLSLIVTIAAVAIGAVFVYESLRPTTTSAEDASLTIVPATQAVNEGDTFTATVIQNASVATIGTQVDLTFDPALVQVVSVERGPAWAGALFLMGVGGQTQAEAIAQANTTGTLPNIALFFLPGSGPVASGENMFLTVAMQARPAVGGTSPITLSNASMFDTSGDPDPISLLVTLTGGEVTVVGSTPGPETPTPTPTPPAPTPTPASPTPTSTAAEASLRIVPGIQTVHAGEAFTLTLVQSTGVATTGAQADLTFNPDLLQVVTVDRGPAYARATFLMGVAPQTTAEAIADANTTGKLKNMAAFFVPGVGPVPAGESSFLTIGMQARPEIVGTSPITLSAAEMLGMDGNPLHVVATGGEVTVLAATPSPTPTPPAAGVFHDGTVRRVRGPASVRLSLGNADNGTVTVVFGNDQSDHADTVGVYVAFLPPGGTNNFGGCSPASVLNLGALSLLPGGSVTLKMDPKWQCANPSAVDGLSWTIKVVADVHADDFGACATLTQVFDGSCAAALANDDNDDFDNFRTRPRPAVVYVGP